MQNVFQIKFKIVVQLQNETVSHLPLQSLTFVKPYPSQLQHSNQA